MNLDDIDRERRRLRRQMFVATLSPYLISIVFVVAMVTVGIMLSILGVL